MGQKISPVVVLLTGLVFFPGGSLADADSAFFGVGLTVLAARPEPVKGVIYRNASYTPGAVAIGLSARGYSQVQLLERNETGYLFSAISSNGQRYLLTVSTWRGEIVSAVRG